MSIRKFLKVSLSAILSLAILASVVVMPAVVSADTVAVPSDNLVVNGSFEDGLNGWKQSYTDFTSVNAADEGLTAPDGTNVMKVVTATKFAWRDQTITVVPNTDYEYSFWVYRPDSNSETIYKIGTAANNTLFNPNGSQTYLNNEATGKWVKKRIIFNSGNNTSIKIAFTAYKGTTYIDNVSLKPVLNFIQNGSFEDDFTSWSGDNSAFKIVDSTEGITAHDGEKFLKVYSESGARWLNRNQTVSIFANTDYIFSVWVYQVDDKSKLILKAGNGTNENEFSPNKSDYNVWEKQTTKGQWIKVTFKFNSGSNTTFKPLFVISGGTTYVDDIKLQRSISVTAAADEGGTVKGLPADVGFGDTITLTATAKKGYTVDGWYLGDQKVSDSAIYNFTASSAANYTAKFIADPALITDGGFEDEILNDGWKVGAGGALSVTNKESYSGKQSALIKPAANWANTRWDLTLKANTDYILRFAAKNTGSTKAIVKLNNPSDKNVLEGAPSNNNLEINVGSTWTVKTYKFSTGSTTAFKLYFTGSSTAVNTYIDNLEIVEAYTVSTVAENGGTVTAPILGLVSGDTATVKATPNAGYWFDGWYCGEELVSTSKNYSFTVTGNTELTAKFVVADKEILVENNSFENGLNNWSTSFANDFAVVEAGEGTPAAIDGKNILKVSATGEWHTLNQNITLQPNTEYEISFWYYRVNDGYITLKFGNSTSDNAVIKESWLNNDAKNKWILKKWTIKTTDDAIVKLFLCAFSGSAYIDDVRIIATENIGNMIQNGDMTNTGKALSAWSGDIGEYFSYDATVEGYTGTGALKIVGDNAGSTWKAVTYTLKVKANTDYVFRFYSKNTASDKKMIYKVLNNSNETLIGGDKHTNGDGADGNGADWGINEWKIKSGENTVIKVQFVERSNGTTYVDDIYFGEAIETITNTTNDKLGKVSSDKMYAGENDEITFTANATAGGDFLGWRIGDSETLIEGKTYTYNGFDDIDIIAVFAAKVGNINEDEAINATDLVVLRGLILNDEDLTLLGDLNGDGIVDARDVVALKKAIVGA